MRNFVIYILMLVMLTVYGQWVAADEHVEPAQKQEWYFGPARFVVPDRNFRNVWGVNEKPGMQVWRLQDTDIIVVIKEF